MPERYKPLRVRTAVYQKKMQGCSWCADRVPPASGGICDKCVEGFKLLLQSRDWGRLRSAHLHRKPDCNCGCNRPADVVDHIKPWRTHPHLFWISTNFQSLHHECHQIKTNREAAELRKLSQAQ